MFAFFCTSSIKVQINQCPYQPKRKNTCHGGELNPRPLSLWETSITTRPLRYLSSSSLLQLFEKVNMPEKLVSFVKTMFFIFYKPIVGCKLHMYTYFYSIVGNVQTKIHIFQIVAFVFNLNIVHQNNSLFSLLFHKSML